MGARTRLSGGLDGPGVMLRGRALEGETTYQYYADLSCHDEGIEDLFAQMSAELLRNLSQDPGNTVRLLNQVLARWKALFATTTGLGAMAVTGLFAELLILTDLLSCDRGAARLWRGPRGERHDFAGPRGAVEVKATLQPEGRTVRIHGLDQLEAPDNGGDLYLAWVRLKRSDEPMARGINELVAQALSMVDDEHEMVNLLSKAGYVFNDRHRYDLEKFIVVEQAWDRVDNTFPRLTGNDLPNLPAQVRQVDYVLDLSHAPVPMAADEAATVTVRMLEVGA